jgi:ElaB/YqjD/DUF883 family membrane-anchored ribosome-binding protein
MNGKLLRVLALAGMATGVAAAQNAPPEKELRLRFGNAGARASASFQSADSIEAELHSRGDALHPLIAALRAQIEAALDEAREALDRNDVADAGEAIARAEALTERFARHFGR